MSVYTKAEETVVSPLAIDCPSRSAQNNKRLGTGHARPTSLDDGSTSRSASSLSSSCSALGILGPTDQSGIVYLSDRRRRAAVKMIASGELWKYLSQSLIVLFAGLGLATVFGIALGLIMARFWVVRRRARYLHHGALFDPIRGVSSRYWSCGSALKSPPRSPWFFFSPSSRWSSTPIKA